MCVCVFLTDSNFCTSPRDKRNSPITREKELKPTDEFASSLPVLSQFFGMFVEVHDGLPNTTGFEALTTDHWELQQEAHPHQ